MKTINGYFAPDSNEIRNAIKHARKVALETGNHIQTWFDTVSGEFELEEFTNDSWTVSLPDYCFNIGLVYGWEEETAEIIESYLKGE